MKTVLPHDIKTVAAAKLLLSTLHKNGESFHPEDDATKLVGDIFTKDEGKHLNRLMCDIYNLPGNDGRHKDMLFCPCQYLNDLIAGDPDSQPIQTITKVTICGLGAHGTISYQSNAHYKHQQIPAAIEDIFNLGDRLTKISFLINYLDKHPQTKIEEAIEKFFPKQQVEVKTKSKKNFQYWIPNLYIHVTID
jgi:ferredoxin-thioredoxin reductase catalytic subunit